MKDLFSEQSSEYAQYRPTYPFSLIEYLIEISPNTQFAWDCGTGNGQMAVLLSPFFNTVYATDISTAQLEHAIKRYNVKYSAQPAEKTNFENDFFDLITVCQAVHWFDFDPFYKEVERVAKPNAVLCLVGYSIPRVSLEIDQILNKLYSDTLKEYWDKERHYIDDAYATIPFRFEELKVPKFEINCFWRLEQFLGYLNTWSAVKHYTKKHHENPIEGLYHDVLPYWNEIQKVTFPLFARVGIVNKF